VYMPNPGQGYAILQGNTTYLYGTRTTMLR
jgi:hypothetical protein